jgi:hypothetical protein
MQFTDPIPIENSVKDEFEAFRKVVDLSDPNQVNMPSIGEFFRNTAWSDRSRIKDFVNDMARNDQNITATSQWVDFTHFARQGPVLSIILCFICHTHLASDVEIQSILAKATFRDPNEMILWQDAQFRQAHIGLQLKCITINDSPLELGVLTEIEQRFGVQRGNQYNWVGLKNFLLAGNPGQTQALNAWTKQDFMLYNLLIFPGIMF